MRQRDEFSGPVKQAAAARVAYLCSNPDCRASTSGPQQEPTKAVNLGVAAHITAASPTGPRYDATLTKAQRSSSENALWLCQNCGKRVDNDKLNFTTTLLRGWKEQAEEEARAKVGKSRSAPNAAGSPRNGQPASPPVPVPNPTPNYPNAEVRFLSERLVDAQVRKRRLEESGADTSEIVQEILGLKRQIREGGQLRAGDYLGDGQYLLLDKVGSGGFGSVWRAHDSESKEIVAIKVLHSNLAGDPERLARFIRGARIMKGLAHAAVVRVLKHHEDDGGWHYSVMEFMPGGDLRRAVLEKRIGAAQAVFLMIEVCDAMALAHSRGIVHRDIRPANILLDASGEPKLTDFDLVTAPDTTGGTRTGAMGTFAYADPMCADRPMDADPRADVYSLAMTVIFGLVGFDLSPTLHGRAQEFVRRLRLPFPLQEVLSRATDLSHREIRYVDAGAFRDALRDAVECGRLSEISRLIVARSGRLVGLILGFPLMALTFLTPAIVPMMVIALTLRPDVRKWVALAWLPIGVVSGAYATIRALRWIERRYPLTVRWLSR